MSFVIIYTVDHYVVDIIGGVIYAVIAAIFGFNSNKILNYFKNRFYNRNLKNNVENMNFSASQTSLLPSSQK